MTTSGERTLAALSVLSGRSVSEVAAEAEVGPELVERWVDLFVEGGTQRLAGRMDPSSFEARERFLTLIAHEFRTPLTIISGWIETLARVELPPEVYSEAVEAMRSAVIQLRTVADDAIDAGAVARGELRLELGQVDLSSILDNVALSHPGRIVGDVIPPTVVAGDERRLEGVVRSVVGHALRLSLGEPIRISLENGSGDEVTVAIDVVGRELAYADAMTLFEPYAREDSSVGTGIGLYLARAILVAHGGEIGVRSEGMQTTFWFRLHRHGPSGLERT